MLVSAWARRVTALLVVLLVALVGGLALAQDAHRPGPPSPQGPPSAPGTPAPTSQPAAPGQPTTPAGFQQTIKGDTAAWVEIETTYNKLDSLSGYRKKSSGPGNFGDTRVDRIWEMVPPNSYHVISGGPSLFPGTPGVTVEEVKVNGETRHRTQETGKPWGPWQCLKPRKPADTKGASIQATVEASRGLDTAIEGTPMRTYLYTIVSTVTFPDKTQRSGTVKTTLYVDAQTSLPRREIEVVFAGLDNRELPSTTTDWYDYGAQIEITLPLCEKEI